MSKRDVNVTVDPLTRIEGHLRIETRVEEGRVAEVHASADMFRGIEKALIGYDARVAQQVTQRVCGVCPYAHAEAASLALEDAMGIQPNRNGQILRNLIVGAYHIQDYLLHFYTLSALDFIDITAIRRYRGKDRAMVALRDWVESEIKSNKIFPASPFLPRYKAAYLGDTDANLSAIKNYLDALGVMAKLHKMVAIFGGKAPHPVAIEAGGVTPVPTLETIGHYRSLLQEVAGFVRDRYLEDVAAVAGAFPGYFGEGQSYGDFLSYPFFPDPDGENHTFTGGATLGGAFQELDPGGIAEDHVYSYYSHTPDTGVRPLDSDSLEPIGWEAFQAEREKADGKYSWAKAPRYQGQPVEVGPVARVVNTYNSGLNPALQERVDTINRQLGIGLADYNSVLGRHLSRYIMAVTLLEGLEKQIEQVEPGKPAFEDHPIPKEATGTGFTEATRGALGHWIETDDKGYIRNYDMIVPTTWNMSPRDAAGKRGAVEEMIAGTQIQDTEHPIEVARIVRSTDPCMACSVH